MKTILIANVAVKMLCVLVLLAAVFNLNAGAKDEIIARMKARLPDIEKLKNAGVVGENNLGYLQVRDNSADTKNAVETENNDRKQVYAAIAAKNNTTADAVGKRRAIKIAEKAARNQWLQNEKGEWYQKP